MLSRVLTRLSPASPASAIQAQGSGAPAPATHGSTARALPPAVPIFTDPSIHEEVEAGTDVRRGLRTAIESLEASLDTNERRDDTLPFFERIARSGEKTVRQPPAAAQRALELLRKDVAISDLARLVEQDPVLAQSLLRFANSVANSTGSQTNSLSECIRRVGTQGLRSVILGSMIEGALCRTGTVYDGMVREVWEHMVRTAPLARQLAPAFGVVPDEAFTLALLHDVGKLVLFDRLGTLRAELRRDVKLSPTVLPRVLGELHEVLGGAAALRWGLGRAAVAVVSSHHRSEVPLVPNLAAECVFLAERLDLAMVRGRPVDLSRLFIDGHLQASFEAVSPIVDRIIAPDAVGGGFRL
jgi:HD-like signal output (HDOD) protein